MMSVDEGTEIATLEISVDDPSLEKHHVLTIRMQKPEMTEAGKYCCSFRIDGLPCGAFLRRVHETNPLLAVYQALRSIVVVANCLPSQFMTSDNAFHHSGMPGIGLPVMPDLREGLAAYRSLNFSRALELLLPYAREGVPELQVIVGSMYLLGDVGGIRKDVPSARTWLLAAGEQGNGQAYFLLCDPGMPDTSDGLRNEYARRASQLGFRMHEG